MNTLISRRLGRYSLLMALLLASPFTARAAGVLQPVDPAAQNVQTNGLQQCKQMIIDDEQTVRQSKLSGENTFFVRKINVQMTGDIPEAEIQPLLAAYENKEVNFTDLQKAANEVNLYLRKKKGYYLATAFYPEQDIQDGIVTMDIVAGTYGKTNIYNQTKLSDHRALSYSAPMKNGKEIKTRTIEGVLENYNNLPGIEAKAIMKPGEKIGESDIDIYLNTLKDTEVSLFTDNYGSKYTGRYRYGANIQFNNPARNGDSFTIGGMLSSSGNTKDWWTSYEMPVGHLGSRMGISYSHMGYELGDWYSRLGGKGRADTLGLYGSTPLIQKSDTFMKLLYGFSWRWFNDRYDAFGYKSDKETRSAYVGIGGAYESSRSYTNYTAIYSRGKTENTHLRLAGENHDELCEDAGNFHKFNLDAVQEDYLGKKKDWRLYFSFHGQMASRALDGSEKMSLGGPYGVRAYPSSEGAVDAGYQFSAEIQHKISDGLWAGPFFDIGEGIMDKNGNNHRRLMGWGLGLQYMNKKEYYHRQPTWYIRLDWARKIKGEDNYSTLTNNDNQIWFRVVTLL